MNVCPVLVGREAELAALGRALDGGGGLVLLAGEAGIGKSRLVREFATHAEEGGHPVVWGRPEAVTRPGPYSLVVDVLEDLASVLREAREEARVLAATLSSGADGRAEPPARQIAARVRGLVGSLGRAPVLAVEDLHSADELSQAVVAHLARSAHDDGLLLVATYRPEEAETEGMQRLLDLLTRDRIATQLDLRPLGPGATLEMVEAMWGRAPTEDESLAIRRLGEGIPFFVEELAGALAGGGGASVPATIARAVGARLRNLDEEGRQVMRAASLSSGALDPVVLAGATGIAEERIPGSLVAAVRAGLLSDQEGRLVFRHALVREAIAEGIVSLEAKELHARLAAAIERFHSDEIEAHGQALARHLRAAGDAERAARYAVVAGNRALSAGALDEARAAFDEARELAAGTPFEPEALAGAGEVRIRSRALEEAEGLLRRASDGYRAAGLPQEAARALLRVAFARAARGEDPVPVHDEALALLDPKEHEREYARVLTEKGTTWARQFDVYREAAPILREALSVAERLEDAELLTEANRGLARVAEHDGDFPTAAARGRRACEYALATGRDQLVGRAHGDHASRLVQHGQGSEALALLELGRDRLVQGLWSAYVPFMDQLFAWTLWRMGMPAEAERYASRLETTHLANIYGRLIRAWGALEGGDPQTALAIVAQWWSALGDEEHRRRAMTNPEPLGISEPENFAILGELLIRALADEPVDAATLAAARTYQEANAAGGDIAFQIASIRARIEVRSGNLDEAARVLAALDEGLAELWFPLRGAEALEVRGLLESARANAKGAFELFERAAETYGSCENSSDRARALRLAAECLHALDGGRDEVVARLKRARELAFTVGATAEVNRAESFMRSIGVRPRAGRPRGSGRPKGALSAREEEVVTLVAAGATNAEISGRLFIAGRTVEDHIARASRRLGVSGRAGLAAWAAKNGLV